MKMHELENSLKVSMSWKAPLHVPDLDFAITTAVETLLEGSIPVQFKFHLQKDD